MFERDDERALMEGERMVTDPATGECYIQLTPEDAADLDAAIAAADAGPTYRIDDIDAFLDELQARADRRRLGDGAVHGRDG